MMASTFPTSRTNSSNIKDGLKEIQLKKEALMALESALKKRVRELRELCLKEGELTGHLPVDYPLQPREPIPQIRRRFNNDNSTTNSIAPPLNRQQLVNRNHQFLGQASSSNPNLATASSFPSRPMSTNSTSSSISTASSQTKSNILFSSSYSSNTNNNGHSFSQISSNNQCNNNNTTDLQDRNQANRCEHLHQPHHHFKRPFNAPIIATFDSDSLGHIRASSTASSSSSSGSATSSTLSAPSALSNLKMPQQLPPIDSNGSHLPHISLNLHGRSCSESITNNNQHYLADRARTGSQNILPRQMMMTDSQQLIDNSTTFTSTSNCPPPMRPPRGLTHSQSLSSNDYNSHHSSKDKVELISRQFSENNTNSSYGNHHHIHKALDVSSVKPLQHFNTNGSFQPYIEEETKPFQMSDYLKYSSKYRQKLSDSQKTTRQLQEENARSKLQANKLNMGEDKIEASMRKIERSGQKLLEATAKAIAGNPGLAEKINQILPNNNDKFLHHHSEKVNE